MRCRLVGYRMQILSGPPQMAPMAPPPPAPAPAPVVVPPAERQAALGKLRNRFGTLADDIMAKLSEAWSTESEPVSDR